MGLDPHRGQISRMSDIYPMTHNNSKITVISSNKDILQLRDHHNMNCIKG